MTSPLPQADTSEEPQPTFDELPRPLRRKLVLQGALWSLITIAVVFVVYFVAPLDKSRSAGTIIQLVLLGLVIFVIMGWQIWRITRSDYPTLRAVEALAFIVPAYIVFCAAVYFVMNHNSPATFGTPLTKLDALYFSGTVFTTVGFGDITAKTQAARAVVFVQMMLDLIILGLVVRLIVNAIKVGQKRRSA